MTKICLKITCLKFPSNFPGANELNINHKTGRFAMSDVHVLPESKFQQPFAITVSGNDIKFQHKV